VFCVLVFMELVYYSAVAYDEGNLFLDQNDIDY
jgi:hypothetical protein